MQAQKDLAREPALDIRLRTYSPAVNPDVCVFRPPGFTYESNCTACTEHQIYSQRIEPAKVGTRLLNKHFAEAAQAAWRGSEHIYMNRHDSFGRLIPSAGSPIDYAQIASQVSLVASRTFSSSPSFDLLMALFGKTPNLHIVPSKSAVPQPISVEFKPQGRVDCCVNDCFDVVCLENANIVPEIWCTINLRADTHMTLHESVDTDGRADSSEFVLMIIHRMLNVYLT